MHLQRGQVLNGSNDVQGLNMTTLARSACDVAMILEEIPAVRFVQNVASQLTQSKEIWAHWVGRVIRPTTEKPDIHVHQGETHLNRFRFILPRCVYAILGLLSLAAWPRSQYATDYV